MTERVRYADMTCERVQHSGTYVIYALVDGHYMSRYYWGYTKREAMRLFHDEANGK